MSEKICVGTWANSEKELVFQAIENMNVDYVDDWEGKYEVEPDGDDAFAIFIDEQWEGYVQTTLAVHIDGFLKGYEHCRDQK